MINFEVSREDRATIVEIADRAIAMARKVTGRSPSFKAFELEMDLSATHNSTPLRLAALLTTDDSNFSHDVFGIMKHIDRRTGMLGGCFVPRFALPVEAGAKELPPDLAAERDAAHELALREAGPITPRETPEQIEIRVLKTALKRLALFCETAAGMNLMYGAKEQSGAIQLSASFASEAAIARSLLARLEEPA